MAVRNYLVEGVSGTGKTSVADELTRRGYKVIHGDRKLAYVGDPKTGKPIEKGTHSNWLWDVDKVKELINDTTDNYLFFCGGSRNTQEFIHLFDKVFVLDVDNDTLRKRLLARPDDEWGGENETELALQLNETKESIPSEGFIIDATQPLNKVVDDILSHIKP